MLKITPHLWYDKEAKEAANFYTKIFPNGKISSTTKLEDTPSGSVDVVNINLMGMDFTLISAGPLFKFTPAISFVVSLDDKDQIDKLWTELSKGGQVLTELSAYPFSQKFGWVQDKYGLSWQLMHAEKENIKQSIVPMFMFVGNVCGKAEEAVNFYTSVFHDSKIGTIMRYGEGEQPDKPGTIKHVAFTLETQEFAALDSAHEHKFGFNEAVSLVINCKDQKEIDYYWDKLTSDPSAEQCGWLKDRYGISWQVVPDEMNDLMAKANKEELGRITQAFLKMKKLDIAKLGEAYKGVASS